MKNNRGIKLLISFALLVGRSFFLTKLSFIALIICAVFTLQACSSSVGGGTTSNQSTSSDGNPSIAAASKILSTGSIQCPDGGISIDTGIDDNKNGMLDTNEVDNTNYICNGQKGINALVKVESEPAGVHCIVGGQKVLIGSDSNVNSTLDSNEVTSTSYICNSTVSTSNPSSILKITSEAAGTNCPVGGIKISSGLDVNGNGTLDSVEVKSTNFVCNGSNGTDGPTSLMNTSIEPAGSNCVYGGIKVESGLDANRNGILDTAEVSSIKFVCNGSSGMLVKTAIESAGTNCAGGGVKLEAGLDTDSNGVLDTAEITSTNFVCNGATPIINNTYCSVGLPSPDSQLSFECDGTASKSIAAYYPVRSCNIETPYKTCTNETCSKYLSHGYYNHNKSSCDDGSSTNETESYACDSGYVLVNNDCVDLLSTLTSEQTCTDAGKYWWNSYCHNGCPIDQVATSRGCESPITTCTPYQMIKDNLCVDMSFTSIAGNICGEYSEPIKILAGNHLVTCDSKFNKKTVIEPGARLLVDNYWEINFTDIYFGGTPTNHIVFNKSAGNLAGGWKKLTIANGTYHYHYANGYLSGNYMSYVDIGGLLNVYYRAVNIENSYVDHLNLSGTYNISVKDTYVNNSIFNLGGVYFNYNYSTKKLNYLLNSTITASSIHLYDTFSAWSTFNSNLYMYSYYRNSAILFSNIIGVNCYSDSNLTYSDYYLSGNKISGSISGTCTQSDNSTLKVSDKIGVYILNEPTNTMYLNQNKEFSALVLNKSGWLTSSSVIWGATYDIDGIVYNYPTTWSGYNPSISFDTKEAYSLNINSIDLNTDLIGKKSIDRINVW